MTEPANQRTLMDIRDSTGNTYLRWISFAANTYYVRQALGFVPQMLSAYDPRYASQQLNAHYVHGGGWRPFRGFSFVPNKGVIGDAPPRIQYPGDPPYVAIAGAQIRNEWIFVFDHGWILVLDTKTTAFEVCRMD